MKLKMESKLLKRCGLFPRTLWVLLILLHLKTTQTTHILSALDSYEVEEKSLPKTNQKIKASLNNHAHTNQSQSRICPIGHFECKTNYLLCVPQSANCNGKADCPDASDEDNCQDPHLKGEWDWTFVKRPDEDAEKHNGTCLYTQTNAYDAKGDFTLEPHKTFTSGESPVSLSPLVRNYQPRRLSVVTKRSKSHSEEEGDDDSDEIIDGQIDIDHILNFDTYWLSKGCLCASEKLFCQNLKLQDLRFLPTNLEFLDLSGSRVENLDFTSPVLPNLRTLVLSGCYIEDIAPRAFDMLPKLQVVYLTDNRLRYIANDVFGGEVYNTSIRRLYLDYNQISVVQAKSFAGLSSLIELNLKHNLLTGREVGVFKPLTSLVILHLNNNKLESLRKSYLLGLSRLETLTLSGNGISYIELGAFENLASLKQLYLNWNKLRVLENRIFCNLRNLLTLNLRGNEISEIQTSAFECLESLTSLNIEKNRFGEINQGTKIFENFTTLKYIYFDHFWMCSWAHHVRSCEPKGDGISSVKNLLDNVVLRVCVWIMGLLSLFGNIFVIFCRIILREPNRVHSFYIRNLAAADLLMGIFLLSIAIHDLSYRGEFLTYQYAWRHSLTCQLSGLLSTLSSESSVLILTLITLDRYLSIVRPFKEKMTSLNIALGICVLIWTLSFLLSYIPISGLFYSYFGNTFYTGNGLCLPLHIHNPYDQGWHYSFVLFVLLNSIAFTFICYAYWKMLKIIQISSRIQSSQQRQDGMLAKRFALVVVTDFVCWAPIVGAKVVAMAGVAIPSELYAWLAVFALPVNSALNPIIYTLTTKLFKQQVVKMSRSFHTRIFRRTGRGALDDSSVSLSLFRYRTTRTANTSLTQSVKSRSKRKGSTTIQLQVKVPQQIAVSPIIGQPGRVMITTTTIGTNAFEEDLVNAFNPETTSSLLVGKSKTASPSGSGSSSIKEIGHPLQSSGSLKEEDII